MYDAIAVIISPDSVTQLGKNPAVRDFICDAFAHFKFIGYNKDVSKLFKKFGLLEDLDKGCVSISKSSEAAGFIETCAQCRYWPRDKSV